MGTRKDKTHRKAIENVKEVLGAQKVLKWEF